MNSPVQENRKAWHDSRVGRFTASIMGTLMIEPRSKEARERGELSEGAKAIISAKAVERITGRPVHTNANFAMKRGTLLEHAAVYLLGQHWQEVSACTWQAMGTNSGATPDGLLVDGTPIDIKCPESEVQLFEYMDQVHDWQSLLKWDKNYAWQIATQAMACGTDKAGLVYFTDKVHSHVLDDEQAATCNAIMAAVGDKLFNLTGQIYDYQLERIDGVCGFAYAPKIIAIPTEAFERISDVLRVCEVECLKMVERYSSSLP